MESLINPFLGYGKNIRCVNPFGNHHRAACVTRQEARSPWIRGSQIVKSNQYVRVYHVQHGGAASCDYHGQRHEKFGNFPIWIPKKFGAL